MSEQQHRSATSRFFLIEPVVNGHNLGTPVQQMVRKYSNIREIWRGLSVPSSSGKTLQQRDGEPVRNSPSRPFSPLFIGEDSSTMVARWHLRRHPRLSVPSS